MIVQYVQKWKLKTKATTYIRKYLQYCEKVKIDDYDVPWTKTVKYLGITLDSKLTWARAIEKKSQPLLFSSFQTLIPHS